MCFGKAFHLILMHFYFLYSMLWDMFSKNQVIFLKRCFFPDFRLIQSNFRSIEILLKKFSEPLSGSIDRTCFSINQTSWIKFFFFKHSVWLIQNTFSKLFKLSSLSPTWQGSTEDILLFSTKYFARFFSPKASKTFIPLLSLLFSWFHA